MENRFQKWNKAICVLFEHPAEELQLEDLSKKARLPRTSTYRYLKELELGGFVVNGKLVDNPYVRFLKAFFIIDKIYTSGLLEYLVKIYVPSLIIVFGSVRKGEYDKQSDLDIFIESPIEKITDTSKFEKKIGHPIQLFVEKDVHKLPSPLFNNVINGIKLWGYVKIR